MAKINFIVGTLGGGSAEIMGVTAKNSRNQRLQFEKPTVFENDVIASYVGGALEQTSDAGYVLNDLEFMFNNKTNLTFESVLVSIGNITSKYLEASEIFLGGPGISLFIEQLLNRYSNASVYFAKRINQNDNNEVILNRMIQLGFEIPEGFLSFVNSLNQQLLESSENLMASLGLSWTTGNSYVISEGINFFSPHYLPEPKANNSSNEIEDMLHKKAIFLKPTALAVYVPRAGFIDFN
jgi:hypothetical protein